MNNKYDPEQVRVYVGVDRSQMVGFEVLKYSILKHTNRSAAVYPMLNLGLPEPEDKRQVQRTGFSFSRFAIPELAGYQGKAIYMDADMQVFTDIGKLWDTPFSEKKMLIQEGLPEAHTRMAGSKIPRKRIKQCSVSLLDCNKLQWDASDIIAGLNGKYTYKELMSDLCILDESEIGYEIPFEWNSLEHWDSNTCNIHYTDMNTQPWVSARNKFGWVWFNEVKEMLQVGALTWDGLKEEVELGYARPSLIAELKLDDDLSVANEKRQKMLEDIDRKANFVMHKEVYVAKKERVLAEKKYVMALMNKKTNKSLSSLVSKVKYFLGKGNQKSIKAQECHRETNHFSERQFTSASPLNILILSNALIPTLEIAFTNPLKRFVKDGLVRYYVLTEQDLKSYSKLSVDKTKKMKERLSKVWRKIDPDLIIFSRYSGPLTKEITVRANTENIPKIVYLDDNLLDVPKELGREKYAYHSHPKRIAAVKYLLENSDVIYSSTQALTEKLAEYGIHNRIFTEKIFCPGRIYPRSRPVNPNKIGYMGFGHEHDLNVVLPGMVKLLRSRQNLQFELFGTIPKPKELDVFGERIIMHTPIYKYQEFMNTLNSLDWAIGICPLANLDFNQYKADTKWVEYSSVGAAVIASDHDVYREAIDDDCGVLVSSEDDWYQAMAGLSDDTVRRDELVGYAQQKVNKEYSPSVFEDQMLELFRHVGISIADGARDVA